MEDMCTLNKFLTQTYKIKDINPIILKISKIQFSDMDFSIKYTFSVHDFYCNGTFIFIAVLLLSEYESSHQ